MDDRVKVKKIDKESYSSIKDYINKSLEYLSRIDDPYYITINNRKYFVCGDDDINIMIKNENELIDSYTYYLNDEDYKQIIKNNYTYIYPTSNEESFVNRICLDNNKLDRITFDEEADGLHLLYYQELNNKDIIQFNYDLTSINSSQLSSHLLYMSNSKPCSVTKKWGLFHKYFLYTDEGSYSPCYALFNKIFIDAKYNYSLWELFSDKKYLSNIPKEMLEILSDNSYEFKEIENVSNIYKKIRKM